MEVGMPGHSVKDLNFSLDPIVKLWILRILVPLGGQHEFISDYYLTNNELAKQLGLGHWVEVDRDDYDVRSIRKELLDAYQKAESGAHQCRIPSTLAKNIKQIKGLIGLTRTDIQLLAFVTTLATDHFLEASIEGLGKLSTRAMYKILAVILSRLEKEIEAALSPDGALVRSGLITLNREATTLDAKLEMLSENFADKLVSSNEDIIQAIRDIVSECEPPSLGIEDFSHLSRELDVLMPYLNHFLKSGRSGVNIFIYGKPGTGKTQLARILAKEFKCQLLEIASEDEFREILDAKKRLKAYRAAQYFFSKRHCLLVFDEVEDVFDDGEGFFGRKSTASTHKAWINRILETNPIPTIWLSNSVDPLDHAFIRRFDMVIEIPVPTKQQRKEIIRANCGGLLSEPMIEQLSYSEDLTPAVINRAITVVATVRETLKHESSPSAVLNLVNNTLEAQGFNGIPAKPADALPGWYDTSYVNTEVDLVQLANGLKRNMSGRLCVYGPPGTGKTAYGRWLADYLDKPLLVKRISEIKSAWIGVTERNLARIFKQAESEGAILLLDEVDSYLQDRRGAQRIWEVTEVNEMLTQMESCNGIFIASTNLLEGLDQAALRRFDIKLKFGYLTQVQAERLLDSYCQNLGLSGSNELDSMRLSRLHNLTPGDFATIARQHHLRPFLTASQLITALEAECGLKEDYSHSIGFV